MFSGTYLASSSRFSACFAWGAVGGGDSAGGYDARILAYRDVVRSMALSRVFLPRWKSWG